MEIFCIGFFSWRNSLWRSLLYKKNGEGEDFQQYSENLLDSRNIWPFKRIVLLNLLKIQGTCGFYLSIFVKTLASLSAWQLRTLRSLCLGGKLFQSLWKSVHCRSHLFDSKLGVNRWLALQSPSPEFLCLHSFSSL